MPGCSGCRKVRCVADTLCPSRAQARDRFLDRALRAAPADDEQVAFAVAKDRRRRQRLLQRRELQAARAHALLVDLGIVGDAARAVVREAGERVHAVRLAGHEAARWPVTGSQS